jgi:uncharacterized membrane protein SpoIIM required for sporulation
MTPTEKPSTNPTPLPHARIILILGFISLLLSWWHLVSVAGFITGIISLYLSKKDLNLYRHNPSQYTIQSFNNIKVGRIFSLMGIAISLIIIMFLVFLYLGLVTTLPFWGMMNRL